MSTYRELLAQRDDLEQQIKEAKEIEVGAAITQVKRLIAEYGLTASDCGFRMRDEEPAPDKVKTPVPVKFRGPDGKTWSGRGKAPNWLVSLEHQGRKREEFRV